MAVIVCTDHHNNEAKELSIHKYVHKPLHQDELRMAVQEVLDRPMNGF